MLLYIAEEIGEVLFCPQCNRELWPAYWNEERLEIGYWSDFEPADGQAGLLVCGNLTCTYEEPVTFVESPTDAVVWSEEGTYMVSAEEQRWDWPQTWLLEYIAEIEHLLAQTGRAKLRTALGLCHQELEERQQSVGRWLAEAEKGYPVTFKAEAEELQGQILSSNSEELILQTPDGQVRVVDRDVVWQEQIVYPRKAGKERPQREDWVGFPMGDFRFMVVGGYHLRYGEPTEMGGYYRGSCRDPVAAAALRLREKVPGYWEGAFQADEIERYYERHDYVKIRGYWVEEVSRNDKHRLVWIRTMDPDVAQALDMEPLYAREDGEFGWWDGDVIAYDEYFSLDEIEGSRWEEDVKVLPPDHWIV
jgi:hypothetical protein